MEAIDTYLEDYKAGTFTKVELERPAKVKKAFKDQNIVKKTVLVARLGIEYDNMGQTQSNRASGEIPKENQGLKWGEWSNYPYTIEHKENKYLRLYADKTQIKTQYFKDGVEVSKSDLEGMLLSSEYSTISDDQKQLTMSAKYSTIKSIG